MHFSKSSVRRNGGDGDSRRAWGPVALALCLGLGLAGQGAADEEPLRFEPAPQANAALPQQVYTPRFSEDDQAWENWAYLFQFPNGYTITSQFLITNAGPNDRSSLAVGMIHAPDGRTALLRNSRKKSEWSYEPAPVGLLLQIARHELEIQPPRHWIKMKHHNGALDLEATATAPALGPSRVGFGGDRDYELTVLAPRLRVRGTAQMGTETPVELGEGWGIAIRSVSSVSEHKQAVSWLRFDSFDKPAQMSLIEFTAPGRHDHQRVGLATLLKDGQILHQAVDFEREYTGFRKDPEGPHYRVPEGFRFSIPGATPGAGPIASGTVRLRQIYRVDLLDWISSGFVRFMVKQSTHPIDYRLHADYEMELKLPGGTEQLKGTGFASVSILNKPPERF